MSMAEKIDDSEDFEMAPEMRGQLLTVHDVKAYATAGWAIFTLQSAKTGMHFTYRVKAPDERRGAVSHFVGVLTGPDNRKHFTYIGELRDNFAGPIFNHGRKAKIGRDSASVRAFDWFWRHLQRDALLPDQLQVWHEGCCGRCGRALTRPDSIARGFGRTCARKL